MHGVYLVWYFKFKKKAIKKIEERETNIFKLSDRNTVKVDSNVHIKS